MKGRHLYLRPFHHHLQEIFPYDLRHQDNYDHPRPHLQEEADYDEEEEGDCYNSFTSSGQTKGTM